MTYKTAFKCRSATKIARIAPHQSVHQHINQSTSTNQTTTTTMAPASVSSAATAAASTAAAGAVLFMSPLRENSKTDAVPSLPMSEATSHRFTLAGTSDAELSALFDAPKQMASNTAVAIRAVPGQLISLGSKLEDGLRDDLKFFLLFAVSGIVVLATFLLMAKFKPSTTNNNKNNPEPKYHQEIGQLVRQRRNDREHRCQAQGRRFA